MIYNLYCGGIRAFRPDSFFMPPFCIESETLILHTVGS
uniref:Uncharacterized protein n=1 Tax=Siphoviridae sp. ctbbV81 TaxID=2827900 RepID=A0A8S5TQU8_9CAUD|nr:MAG TPA: hypothetical protein [Siphoviridae sp. ctbbV81]